jgi:hypothetical protein
MGQAHVRGLKVQAYGGGGAPSVEILQPIPSVAERKKACSHQTRQS